MMLSLNGWEFVCGSALMASGVRQEFFVRFALHAKARSCRLDNGFNMHGVFVFEQCQIVV